MGTGSGGTAGDEQEGGGEQVEGGRDILFLRDLRDFESNHYYS